MGKKGAYTDPTNLDSKLPPHNVEAEQAVLGSIIIDNVRFAEISDFLKPEHFFREQNGWVYEAITLLSDMGMAMDQITVASQLSSMQRLEEIGGAAYLAHLVFSTPTSIHVVHYARLVFELAIMRKVIVCAGKIAGLAFQCEGRAMDILQKSHAILDRVGSELTSANLFDNLRKQPSDPPVYYLGVNGHDVKVGGEELMEYRKLRRRVMEKTDFVPPPMKTEEWAAVLNRLLNSLTIIPDTPDEASGDYLIWLSALNWVQERPVVDTLEEYRVGKPTERGDALFVKGEPFITGVRQKMKGTTLQSHTFWAILREHGVKSTVVRFGENLERGWRIPNSLLKEAEIAQEIKDDWEI